MAFKNNVITATAGGPDVVLFTCPVGAEASIHTLFLDSQGGTGQATLKLTLQATGQTVTFLDGFSLADNEPFTFPKPINMTEGDELSLSATASDIVALLSAFQDGATGTTASFNPRGEYDNTATYDRLDVVSVSGTSFIAINDGISGDTPPSTNWMILAEPDNRRTDQEIRDLFSAGGDLIYNSSTGEFSVNAGTDLSTSTTDDLSEGTTNLYYTDTRARNSVSASGDLTYDSGTGVFSITTTERALILQPENISPTDNATDTLLTPELEASAYRSLYGLGMASAQWQISEVQDFATTVVDQTVAGTSTTFTPSSNLDTLTNYYWRVRYTDDDGNVSDFSDATEFTTADIFTDQPTITSPTDGETDIGETPTITSSAFNTVNGSDTHVASEWEITRVSDGVVVFDSGEDTTNLTSIDVPAGVLDEGQESYTVKVRHKGQTFGFSAYSPDVTFTTSASFLDPEDPQFIGQAFAGGFLVGVIDTVAGTIDSQDDYQTGERYALVVAPKSLETGPGPKWDSQGRTGEAGSFTRWDGLSSTDSILAKNDTSYEAFEHIRSIRSSDPVPSDGGSDWYLPAMDELELIYRNLKPVTADNRVFDETRAFPGQQNSGFNPSSDPIGSAYTASGEPFQTTVTDFQDGGAEAVDLERYWSSTDADEGGRAWNQFVTRSGTEGAQFASEKEVTGRSVRPVRRVPL